MFLLDCTLRDGGYYNSWDFSVQLIGNGRHLQKTIWYFLVRGQ